MHNILKISAGLPRREHRAARRHALAIAGATLLATGLPAAASISFQRSSDTVLP